MVRVPGGGVRAPDRPGERLVQVARGLLRVREDRVVDGEDDFGGLVFVAEGGPAVEVDRRGAVYACSTWLWEDSVFACGQ